MLVLYLLSKASVDAGLPDASFTIKSRSLDTSDNTLVLPYSSHYQNNNDKVSRAIQGLGAQNLGRWWSVYSLSLSNTLYGKSQTVQPLSIEVKYFICYQKLASLKLW